MKAKKIRELLIGCFLVSTLGLAGILVSCSEDGGLVIGPSHNGSNPYLTAGTSASPMSAMFLSLGKGAASAAGGEIAGWALGALGLSNSSSNYQHQINQILNQLTLIAQTLTDIDNTLHDIEQTLNAMNCGEQQVPLDDDVAAINTLYSSTSLSYKNFITKILDNDTVATADMKEWSDKVLAKGSYTGQNPLAYYINHMSANLNRTTGAIVACMGTISPPTEGILANDTVYYNQVYAITNYYYYWQTVALTLINEAEHFYAWYEAGQPGGTYTSSDSIQVVCSANSTSEGHCMSAANQTNQLFNDLITQHTFSGAPYTGEYFAYQHFNDEPIAWVKSLEDFTSDGGYDCISPLTNAHPCGPASGYYFTKLNDSTYRSTSGNFRFAKGSELRDLIDVTKVGSMTNGAFLETQGFKNMSGKTIMASDSVRVYPAYTGYDGSLQTIVPFFNTDIGLINNGHSSVSVYYTQNDYQGILLHATHESNRDGTCGPHNYYTSRLYHYHYNSNLGTLENWLVTYAKTRVCEDNSIISAFEYTDHNYNGSNCCLPGYLTSSQRKGTAGKRYLFPVFSTLNATCTNNRTPLNAKGVPTLCGDDFTAFLQFNVPRPLSCDIKNVGTTCRNID